MVVHNDPNHDPHSHVTNLITLFGLYLLFIYNVSGMVDGFVEYNVAFEKPAISTTYVSS